MSIWPQVYHAFDPEQPVIDHPDWRVDRTEHPAQRIGSLLDLPMGTPRILLTGTVGSGKSTELHRLANTRAGKEFVVLLDLDRHFAEVVADPSALQKVASWEVCFLVGLALLRAAEERLDLALPEHSRDLAAAWQSAARQSSAADGAEIDVGALARSMVVFASAGVGALAGGPPGAGAAGAVTISALGAAKEATTGLKWRLPLGLGRASLPDQDEHLQRILLVVNRIVGAIQQAHLPVLLVIDGLDRIREVAHARAMFVESELLGRIASRLVVCGPYALRHRPELAQVRGGFRPVTLVNEPVLDQNDPRRAGPGLAVFRSLFERRTRSFGVDLIAPADLDRLAFCSGGRARDFVRFIRILAEQCTLAAVERAGPAHVEAVLDEARRLRETGLNRKHIQLLKELALDPSHRLPDDPAAWDLLQWDCILPYPDGSEWFYPHPLLLLNLVKPWPIGSSG